MEFPANRRTSFDFSTGQEPPLFLCDGAMGLGQSRMGGAARAACVHAVCMVSDANELVDDGSGLRVMSSRWAVGDWESWRGWSVGEVFMRVFRDFYEGFRDRNSGGHI